MILVSSERSLTSVTTEMTALVNGIETTGLNSLQQSAADANIHITGLSGAVQDTISGEAKRALFNNVQRVVTGQMSAAEAVELAIRLN